MDIQQTLQSKGILFFSFLCTKAKVCILSKTIQETFYFIKLTKIPMRPLGKTDHIDPINALDQFNCTPSAEANIKLVSTKQEKKTVQRIKHILKYCLK